MMTTAIYIDSDQMHYRHEGVGTLTAFLPDKDPNHLEEVLLEECKACLVTLLHNDTHPQLWAEEQ